MDMHIKFLRYLKKSGGALDPINVTKKLISLGLKNENHIENFLNELREKNFIEWEDHRPRVPDRDTSGSGIIFLGGFPSKDAPLDYTAKILLAGVEHLGEWKIKTGQNNWLIVSIIVAIISIAVSGWLTYSNNEKDIEIRTLKQEMSNSSKASNRQIEKLNADLAKTKQSLQTLREQRAKDSILANMPPTGKKQ